MTIRHFSDDPRWREPHVPDRVIIELVHGADHKQFDTIVLNHGGRERKHLLAINRHVVILDPGEIEGLLEELEQAGLLADAEPDGLLHAGSDPDAGSDRTPFDPEGIEEYVLVNDPYIGKQWHINNIGLPNAWGITQGAVTVKLAMLDSGCYAHPDIKATTIPGYDFVNYDNNTTDTGALGGHGTATAGTAGAISNNGVGIAGVAQVRVMPLVVLASNNYAAWSDVADGITYAVDHGCRVLNISIGGTSPSSTLDKATTYAWSKGSVIFASAMNNHNSTPNYPAACQCVVAVAATNANNVLASFSNYGTWVDLAGPGQAIFTLYKVGSYANWSGTSFASPICAGVAALMISANPNITNSKIVSILKQTADVVSGQPFGRVNAYKAVAAAKAA